MSTAVALLPVHANHHERSESLRALRTEILLRRETPKRADLVAIVSASSAEGRSTLAAELAIAEVETYFVAADLDGLDDEDVH